MLCGGTDLRENPTSCGRPMPFFDVKLVDEDGREVPDGALGEVLLRSPTVTPGYWNRPEATAETIRDGWLHTGDIARRDAHGLYHLVDRAKDMIIRGGENVYSVEVENCLAAHPEIDEAAIIGAPDPDVGERVKAVIYRIPGSQLTAERRACPRRFEARCVQGSRARRVPRRAAAAQPRRQGVEERAARTGASGVRVRPGRNVVSGSPGIVVVTGAAGFVGRHLVRLLVEGGARVRATDRVPEDREFFGPLGVEYVVADVTAPASLRQVFEGSIDRVFHLGAICNFTVPYNRLRPVNVEGARHVAELSRRAGVRRFVHMSSTAVYGRYPGRPFTEETPRAPVDDYGRSKRDGEDEVFAQTREGLPVTVLRPCTIYGPGCSDGAGKVFSRRSSVGAIPGSGRQVLSNVRVEDVAAAAEYLSQRPETSGQAYNLVDESRPTLEEALTLAAEVFGSPRPRLRVPLSAVEAVARVATLAGRLSGRIPDLEHAAVKYLANDYIVDGSKLRSTGFTARHPDFSESMRAMGHATSRRVET